MGCSVFAVVSEESEMEREFSVKGVRSCGGASGKWEGNVVTLVRKDSAGNTGGIECRDAGNGGRDAAPFAGGINSCAW